MSGDLKVFANRVGKQMEIASEADTEDFQAPLVFNHYKFCKHICYFVLLKCNDCIIGNAF